jgi:hypothetical protein
MPVLYREFGVLAVRDGLPSRRERAFESGRKKVLIDGCNWDSVNAGPERFLRHEMIGRVSGIDFDDLGSGQRKQERGKNRDSRKQRKPPY